MNPLHATKFMKNLQGTSLGLRGLIGFLGLMVCFVTPSQACPWPPSCSSQAAAAERESASSALSLYSLHGHFVGLKDRLTQARPAGLQHHAASERTGWGSSSPYRLELIAQEPRLHVLPVVTRVP
jgi:hypothetical protein